MSTDVWQRTGIIIGSVFSCLTVIVVCILYVANLDKDKEIKIALMQNDMEHMKAEIKSLEEKDQKQDAIIMEMKRKLFKD